jgi:hypothetical protein
MMMSSIGMLLAVGGMRCHLNVRAMHDLQPPRVREDSTHLFERQTWHPTDIFSRWERGRLYRNPI